MCSGVRSECIRSIGVNIGRINYQDNGNWKPELHIHLYCRATDATMQKYGDPIVPGHRDEYKPLTEEDIKRVGEEVGMVFKEERFSDSKWYCK